MTPKEVEKFFQLMQKYQIDRLEMPELKIEKSQHLIAMVEKPFPVNENVLSDEEIMFHSTSAPQLTLEEYDAASSNPPPPFTKE